MNSIVTSDRSSIELSLVTYHSYVLLITCHLSLSLSLITILAGMARLELANKGLKNLSRDRFAFIPFQITMREARLELATTRV